MVLKADLERENQELRAQVAELLAERPRRRRSSESDALSASTPRRSGSVTSSTLLRNYLPNQTPAPSEPRPPSPSRTPTPVVPAPVLKDLKIEPPPEFNGKTAKYATFLSACQFYFNNKPVTFPRDHDANRINLVISRLHGNPMVWAHAIACANKDDPILHS